MSIKNLFVNARTKILEFKRKHNFLVEKVKSVEEEIPTTEQITSIANLAIQTDKDILSKITVEYDETENKTFIIFPEYIYPIRIKSQYGGGSTYYLIKFYQGSFFFTNSSNTNVGKVIVNSNKIKLEVSGNVASQWENQIKSVEYINFTGSPLDYKSINWYSIYNPPSVGTKLYKHTFDINDGENDLNLIVVDNRSSVYNTPQEITNQPLNKYLCAYVDNKIIVYMSGTQIIYLNSSGSVTTITIASFGEDSVTSL